MNIKRIIFIAATIFISLSAMSQKNYSPSINYKPIGVFHTSYTPSTGAPRQGILEPEIKGEIEIFPEYRDALKSLDLFEYIIVIYHFDRSLRWESLVSPPGSNPDFAFGLFATRSPNRPNPIGIATLRLGKIEDGVLYVYGTDAFDGTPVLDIKPYIQSVDAVESSRNKLLEKELGLMDPLSGK